MKSVSMIIVKVSHLCTTNFMNYIPIFLQLLKELPRSFHQVVEKVPLVTSGHPVLIEKEVCIERHRFVCPVNQK